MCLASHLTGLGSTPSVQLTLMRDKEEAIAVREGVLGKFDIRVAQADYLMMLEKQKAIKETIQELRLDSERRRNAHTKSVEVEKVFTSTSFKK